MLKTEAIVLKSLVYKENERILTLMTREMGLVSAIVKGVTPRRLERLAATAPFCQAEFVFVKGRSDLLLYRDSAVISENLGLRSSLSHLEAAATLASAILKTQLPGENEPTLYLLLESYLKQIPSFAQPRVLVASFLLKMLRLEGLLAENGEGSFTEEENVLAKELVEARSFKDLRERAVSVEFAQKAESYFFKTCPGL